MEFKNIEDFQAALNSYVSVVEWEILTAAIQIPEECLPLAYARLADLTSQVRIEVSLFWLISRSISFSWSFFRFSQLTNSMTNCLKKKMF